MSESCDGDIRAGTTRIRSRLTGAGRIDNIIIESQSSFMMMNQDDESSCRTIPGLVQEKRDI